MSEPYLPPFVKEALDRLQQKRLRRKRFWRRLLKFTLGALILIVAVPTSFFFYHRFKASRELEQAIAETDQLDPGWRMEDLKAAQAQLPFEENAAIPLMQAGSVLPSGWLSIGGWKGRDHRELMEVLAKWRIDPTVQIEPELIEQLRKATAAFPTVLPTAREAVPMKKAFYPFDWKGGYHSLIETEKAFVLFGYLRCLVAVANHDGEFDEAWQAIFVIQAVGRSFGDLPGLFWYPMRQGCAGLRDMEQCLALGQVSENLLAKAQQDVAHEAGLPTLYDFLRAQRAEWDLRFRKLESGEKPVNRRIWVISGDDKLTNQERIEFWAYGNTFKGQHARFLRYMNNLMKTSSLSPRDQMKRVEELSAGFEKMEDSLFHFFLTYTRHSKQYVRDKALLACTNAALGVERFRLKNNRWPDSLEEVVAAKLLDSVPEDPFDGKPLRYRKASDGVVVYSVGPKGNYNGDALDPGREFDPEFIRDEFRLWDEAHRCQLPRLRLKGGGEKKADGG